MRNYSFSLADVKVNLIPYEGPDLTIFFFVKDNLCIIQQIIKKMFFASYIQA